MGQIELASRVHVDEIILDIEDQVVKDEQVSALFDFIIDLLWAERLNLSSYGWCLNLTF